MPENSPKVFISYNKADRDWAEWIAGVIEGAGYEPILQAWHFRPGENFVLRMHEATAETNITIAVLSEAYLKAEYTQPEWAAAFARDPTGKERHLIPVRVTACSPTGLLAQVIYIDLVDLNEQDAGRTLLDGLKPSGKPTGPPSFPTSAKPRAGFPPAAPRRTHNLPFPPNPTFTGRDAELNKLHEQFQKGSEAAATQTIAVHGLGGVGKTQLAIEYAWKHLGEYDAVLWVKGDSAEALDANLAALAGLLDLPEDVERRQSLQAKAVLDWFHGHERWLLIADSVDTQEAVKAVRDRLPPSLAGHVLVTSRLSEWPVTMPDFHLDLLTPGDSACFLLRRVAEEGHNAGDENAALLLARELGNLPLALEQAAAFIVTVKWSFEKYQYAFHEARPELLEYQPEGSTRYPASVAKTWDVTFNQLSPLARALLRIGAWFAPDGIPCAIFAADKGVLSEALSQRVNASGVAIDKALGELARFSLIRLTSETLAMHPLLQAVEQDSLTGEERKRWLMRAAQLLHAFAPGSPDDFRTWDVWLALWPHAEMLIEHAKRDGVDEILIASVAHQLGAFLRARAAYPQAEQLFYFSLSIRAKVLGPEHPNVASSLNALAVAWKDQGQYAKAEPLYERALAIWEKALGPDHPDVATGLNNLARLYMSRGEYAKAEPLYRRALAIWETALGPEDAQIATCLNNLAVACTNQGQYKKAEPLFERALAIRERVLDPDDPDLAINFNDLALFHESQGQYAKAEPLYERALAIWEKALGPDHPDVATGLNNLAGLCISRCEYAKAEPLYERALAIREKALDPNHPDVATGLSNLADLYRNWGGYAKAEPLYERALAIREKALGPEHPEVAASLDGLALMLKAQGQYAKAEPLYERALAIRKKVLGPEHSDIAGSLNNLAMLYRAQGQYTKAEPMCEQALSISERALGPEHPDTARILNNLAELYTTHGQYAKAEPLTKRAVEIVEKRLGPDHPDLAMCLNNLALLFQATGRLEEAEPLSRRHLTILFQFVVSTGRAHPHLHDGVTNYAALLKQMGRSSAQTLAELNNVARPFGMRINSDQVD